MEWRYFQWPSVTPNYPKPPHFRSFVSIFICSYWVEIESSNLVSRLIVAIASRRKTNHPWKGRGQVTWTILILVGTNHISKTAEAAVVTFCAQVGYVKSRHKDYKRPLTLKRGVIRLTWPILFRCAQSYLPNGWSESRLILYAGRIYQILAVGCMGDRYLVMAWARSRDPFS